jgi:Domain of unknown function (DUF4232)
MMGGMLLRRAWLLPLLVALLATTAAAGASARVASARPACATADLVVWLDTQGSGAAGSVYYTLRFTNLSGHACTLFGFAGVSAIDLRGRRVGKAATRNPVRAHTVTLERGATARAVLQLVNVDNFPAAACRKVTAAGLRVYPPGQRAAKTIPFPFRACSRRAGPAFLHISPVK